MSALGRKRTFTTRIGSLVMNDCNGWKADIGEWAQRRHFERLLSPIGRSVRVRPRQLLLALLAARLLRSNRRDSKSWRVRWLTKYEEDAVRCAIVGQGNEILLISSDRVSVDFYG